MSCCRPTRVLRLFLLSNKNSFVLFFEYLMNSFACLCPGVLFQYEALVLASRDYGPHFGRFMLCIVASHCVIYSLVYYLHSTICMARATARGQQNKEEEDLSKLKMILSSINFQFSCSLRNISIPRYSLQVMNE